MKPWHLSPHFICLPLSTLNSSLVSMPSSNLQVWGNVSWNRAWDNQTTKSVITPSTSLKITSTRSPTFIHHLLLYYWYSCAVHDIYYYFTNILYLVPSNPIKPSTVYCLAQLPSLSVFPPLGPNPYPPYISPSISPISPSLSPPLSLLVICKTVAWQLYLW